MSVSIETRELKMKPITEQGAGVCISTVATPQLTGSSSVKKNS